MKAIINSEEIVASLKSHQRHGEKISAAGNMKSINNQ
jgi:hypothetical protein